MRIRLASCPALRKLASAGALAGSLALASPAVADNGYYGGGGHYTASPAWGPGYYESRYSTPYYGYGYSGYDSSRYYPASDYYYDVYYYDYPYHRYYHHPHHRRR